MNESAHPATDAAEPRTADVPPGRVKARIVLDAAGGDKSLQVRVAGALAAAERYDDIQVILCGPADEIEGALKRERSHPANMTIVHAPDSIGMHEPPVQAVRERKESSVVVGVKTVASGDRKSVV